MLRKPVVLLATAMPFVFLLQSASAQKTDHDHLQGHWFIHSMEKNGKEIPSERIKSIDLVVEFSGDKLIQKVDGKIIREARIRIDSTATPKTIDTTFEELVEKGIYKLDGDELTICTGTKPSSVRPTKFQTAVNRNHVLMVLRRKR